MKLYDNNEYDILCGIVYNNRNIYILVNQLQTTPIIYYYNNIKSHISHYIYNK